MDRVYTVECETTRSARNSKLNKADAKRWLRALRLGVLQVFTAVVGVALGW